MKLKCNDGATRTFEIACIDPISSRYIEAYCVLCGHLFGVHDTKILKPEFKEHICNEESE